MLKQNNPFNLINSPTKYKGEVPSKNSYKAFETMALGYRAGFANIVHHIRHGKETVEKLINVFCPADDGTPLTKGNNPEIYIKFICDKTGLSRNEKIQVNPIFLIPIGEAISKMENGVDAVDEDINNGWKLFEKDYLT